MTRQIIDNKLKCRTCKEWLPLDYFSVNNAMKHGRDGQCRFCRSRTRSKDSNRYQQRREKQITYSTNWNKAHPEQVRSYNRSYYHRLNA